MAYPLLYKEGSTPSTLGFATTGVAKTEAKALSPTQVRTLLSAARGTCYEALYVTAVHTGLRQGELLGLRWSDVDLEARKLCVTRSLKVTANGLGFGAPKNQASRRSVPLNKSVVSTLRTHRLRQNEERVFAPEWHDHDLVFPNRVGRPTDHNNLYYREFKPLLENAGLWDQGFTFHSLRHTFATALFERRQHPKIDSLSWVMRPSRRQWTRTLTC